MEFGERISLLPAAVTRLGSNKACNGRHCLVVVVGVVVVTPFWIPREPNDRDGRDTTNGLVVKAETENSLTNNKINGTADANPLMTKSFFFVMS